MDDLKKNDERYESKTMYNSTFSPAYIKSIKARENIIRVLIYAILIITSLPIFVGYLWILLASFSKEMPTGLMPNGLTLANWRFLWESPDLHKTMPVVWPVFFNTLFLGLGTALLSVVVSTPAGYALSRMKVPGRKSILALTLILHGFPGVSLLIALYWVLSTLGMIDTLLGVIMVSTGLMLPFSIWVMKGFFDGIPWDIEMSAFIDGASRFKTWYTVMLPQVLPGVFAISIFTFIVGWSSFIYVVVFIISKSGWTLSSYVYATLGDFGFLDFGLLSAVATFYITPVLLFFIFANKYLKRVTVGGMKGGK
jgi:inositol-phosphate transport system permease protein